MIARRLTMVAHVERSVAGARDAWNMPTGTFEPLAEVPCFAWVPKAGVDIVDGKKVAVQQDVRLMFALGIDLRVDDQVAKIVDRRGTILFAGPLRVEGRVDFKHNHQEVALVRVAG